MTLAFRARWLQSKKRTKTRDLKENKTKNIHLIKNA